MTELPLFVHWERTLNDLLDRTMKFPKAVRFTFSTRIDNCALDVMERVVAARYARQRETGDHLEAIDRDLARLRILLRLCHSRRYLDPGGYEHVMRNIDEAGRMVGGWRKERTRREESGTPV